MHKARLSLLDVILTTLDACVTILAAQQFTRKYTLSCFPYFTRHPQQPQPQQHTFLLKVIILLNVLFTVISCGIQTCKTAVKLSIQCLTVVIDSLSVSSLAELVTFYCLDKAIKLKMFFYIDVCLPNLHNFSFIDHQDDGCCPHFAKQLTTSTLPVFIHYHLIIIIWPTRLGFTEQSYSRHSSTALCFQEPPCQSRNPSRSYLGMSVSNLITG